MARLKIKKFFGGELAQFKQRGAIIRMQRFPKEKKFFVTSQRGIVITPIGKITREQVNEVIRVRRKGKAIRFGGLM